MPRTRLPARRSQRPVGAGRNAPWLLRRAWAVALCAALLGVVGVTARAAAEDGGEQAPGDSDGVDAAVDAAAPPGSITARCVDGTGEPENAGFADIDLVEVVLSRSLEGLRLTFEVAGEPAPHEPSGDPLARSTWEVLLTDGESPLYRATATRDGSGWTSELLDFSSMRQTDLPPPTATGRRIALRVPASEVGGLPPAFHWYALTETTRIASEAPYIGDDCPDGASLDPRSALEFPS